jgi:hypothetical protein
MAEYLVRVRGQKSKALFFVFLPAEKLDQLRPQFDRIVGTLQIP